uniref:PIF1/LRR1 pleckstrin homology domain-containing protein n=1 Tax=Acrobeloides nanus TaxID=290746 RepID=A0A914CUA0_9BILA
MKLDCLLLIAPAKKPIQGTIFIGNATKGYKLVVKTRNKGQNRELLLHKENVKGIIDKFSGAGKATIMFQNLNVLISEAQPEKLRQFMAVLKQCLSSNGEKPVSLPRLHTSDFKENLPPPKPKKMEILERNEYFSSSLQFPQTLYDLRISVQLKKVGSKEIAWLGLKNLTRLNLDGNLFCLLKREDWRKFEKISRLENLQELYMRENQLRFLPEPFIEALPKNLFHLDISENELSYIPPKLFHLHKSLSHLFISNNRLRYIPNFFRRFRLMQSDFSANSIYPGVKNVLDENRLNLVPTLYDLASTTLLNNRAWLEVANGILPVLVKHNIFDSALTCSTCLKFVPSSGLNQITSKPLDPASFSNITTRIGCVEARVVKCCNC